MSIIDEIREKAVEELIEAREKVQLELLAKKHKYKLVEDNNDDVRKILASKDDTYAFKANFDAVEDINWDMFKNE